MKNKKYKKNSFQEVQTKDESRGNYILTNHNLGKDLTKDYDYEKLVEEELDEYCSIEVTDDLRQGGIHAFKAWEYWFKFLAGNIWKTSLFEEVVTFANSIRNPKILSLGCGYSGYELSITKSLNKPFEMVVVDINPHIFAQAADEARANELNIKFEAADLNFVRIKEDCFDIIYAHASLHHIINLENLFYQIYRGLRKKGHFIIVDMIGKNQVLFWEENINFARDIIKLMPSKYKSEILNIDTIIPPIKPYKGMEGIRQEEIESQISQYFTPVKMFKYGSFIRMICTNKFIGERINPEIKDDKDYLEYLFNLDLKMVEENKLRPTEMFAVLRKKNFPDIKE